MFVRGRQYKRRFDFDGVSQRLAEQALRMEVNRAVAESLARLQSRNA